MVRWLAPKEIVRGAYGEFFGRLFGAYADSRETQAALREPVVHHRQGWISGERLGRIDPQDFSVFCNDQLPFQAAAEWPAELIVDYVADLGDGFSSTFTVARQMAEPVTVVADADGSQRSLEKGRLIIMGGDEVYPAAGPEHYRDRTIGPYRTAFPPLDAGESPGEVSGGPGRVTPAPAADPRVPLFAIPGNHDWYDGLSAFLERFTVYKAGDDDSRRRGWSLHQTRSYFALQLNDSWWLWGIDIALNADIDTPQMQYFRQVAAMMPADARIVLCTGKPAWFRRAEKGRFENWINGLRQRFGHQKPPPHDEWDRLTYFLEQTLGPSAPSAVRLVLTGDKHYYARHEPVTDGDRPTVVVAGGGGAYLASTLEGPTSLDLPWQFSSEEITNYQVAEEWPSRSASRRIGLRALYRIPLRNPELGMVLGIIYTLFGLAARAGAREAFVQSAAADEPIEVLEPFVGGPFWRDQLQVLWGAAHNVGAWVMVGALAVALFAMAKAHRRAWYVAGLATTFHMLLHGIAATATVGVAARLTEAVPTTDSPLAGFLWVDSMLSTWPTASFAILIGLIGAGAGLVSFALYLALMQYVGVNLNELFVGMRLADYKHFLRLQVTDDAIVGHVIGFSSVPDLDLDWVDGEPVVTGKRAVPHLVDRFTVSANRPTDAMSPVPSVV
ncbi:MAG: hypothetical protein OER95_07370 [Acidimicrobiia bacterium]|nr:hypothetical protein [Acidimicrobiia bacterium]